MTTQRHGGVDSEVNSPARIGLQALAGVAALGTAVAFVGGAVLWLRFDKLELPADQAIALLPKQLLVVVGASALLAAVVFAAVAALLLALVGSPTRGTVTRGFQAALALVVFVALVLAILLMHDYQWFEQGVVYATVLGGAAIIFATAKRSSLRRHVAEVVLVVFVACGALIAIVRTAAAPKMEPVAVLLKDDKAVTGFYVGQTGDRLYVAPLPGLGDPGDAFADARIDRLVELRRDDVVRMALRAPASIEGDGGGRHFAQALLNDLRAQFAGAQAPAGEQVVATASPEAAFAPLVHLHSHEPAHPMSAEAFLANSWLMWAHDDCDDYSLELEAHLARPAARREQIMGRFERRRLGGPDAYTHAPADRGCRDARQTFTAAQHTRAFDRKGRPDGLALKEGFYLDLWDNMRRPKPRVEHEGPQLMLKPTPVYFERSSEQRDGRAHLRITYWLFYGLSIPPGGDVSKLVSHEGDWERVSVLLRPGPGAGQYVPVSARYHYHDESRNVPWSVVDRVGVGADPPTHPVVFSARGSHASFPRAGRYPSVLKVAGRPRLTVNDEATACPACPQWRTWEMLLDATAQPWYGFGGAWGKAGSIPGTTGPLGPSAFKIRGLSPSPVDAVKPNGPPVPNAAPGRR